MGLPPGYAPGALARQSQARLRNRTGGNFCIPRAQWPGWNLDHPLRFCAPKTLQNLTGTRPPQWGPGKAVLWARSVHRPRPRWRFGYFAAMGKVTRRPQAAKFPLRTTNPIRTLSPHPSRLRRATFPYPLCRFATSPLDKGSRPPGGRLKSRRRRKPLRFKNQLSCKSCFSSASRFRASMGDKMFTSVIRSF